MQDHEIDNLFHSGLKNQHFEITDVYTDDLLNRLGEKKKRRVFFGIFGGIGTCIIILLTSTAFLNSNKVSLAKQTPSYDMKLLQKDANQAVGNRRGNFKSKLSNLINYGSNNLALKPIEKASFDDLNIEQREAFIHYGSGVDVNNKSRFSAELAHLSDTEIKSTQLDMPTQTEKEITINQLVITPQNVIAPQHKGSVVNLLLSLETGVNFNSAKYAGVSSEYYQSNNSDKITMNYELNASALVRNKFSLGVGIGMNEHKYDYEYKTSSFSYDTTHVIDSTYVFEHYIYSGGVIIDSVYHYDHYSSTEIDSTMYTNNFNGVTQAKYLTVPISVGYHFTHNKFMIGLYMTTRINILRSAKGGYYDSNSFEVFDNSNNPLFKKSYLSISFKGQASFNIWKNMFLSGSIGYSPYFKPVIQTVALQRKTQMLNASFGLTYKL